MADEIIPPYGCAFIPVGKEHVALVDAEDAEHLLQFKWHLNSGYAQTSIKSGDRYTTVAMHRMVNQTPAGMHTDHINRVPLDNRKCNLRTCTARQNRYNTVTRADGEIPYKGVSMRKSYGSRPCYIAAIRLPNGKRKMLGCFKTAREAAFAYDNAATFHGEFSRKNNPA